MSLGNSVCSGLCKKFQVTKPVGMGRYESGQGHCQTCNIWIDHRGCRMKNGIPAKEGSLGWFCNCCNYRVRQKPRNKVYKEKLRNNKQSDGDSNISRQQANLLKKITPILNKYSNKDFQKIKAEIPKSTNLSTVEARTNFIENADDYEQESMEDVVKKFENLKTEIHNSCKEKDVQNPENYYSYVEMFALLEKYLKLLPKKLKYENIKNFL